MTGMAKRITRFMLGLMFMLMSAAPVAADAPVITVGNVQPWGHYLLYHTEPNFIANPLVHIVWDPANTVAHIYCGVTYHTPNLAVPTDWVPVFDAHPPATDFYLGCSTKYILFATGAEPQIINGWVVPSNPNPR